MFSRTVVRSWKIISKSPLATLHLQTRFQATSTSFQEWQAKSTNDINMATSNRIVLGIDDTGVVKFKPQTREAAAKTSELLQENHEVQSINIIFLAF